MSEMSRLLMRCVRFLARPVPLSVVGMLFASAVAVDAFGLVLGVSLFCSGQPLRGANIVHAVGVAFFGGLAGSIVIVVVRKRPRLLAAVLLLGATTLIVAISLVALDSATYVQENSACAVLGPPGKGTSTAHLGYLYLLWGVPLCMLLVQAGRALHQARVRAQTNRLSGHRVRAK